MPKKQSSKISVSASASDVEMSSSSSTCKNYSDGIMMILSPAKTLDLSPLENDNDTRTHNLSWSQPNCNPNQMQTVAQAMKTRTESELSQLLGISKNLAKTAFEYWTNFEVTEEEEDTKKKNLRKPAIYAFSGAAYQGLDIASCSMETILYLQENLRIIDPLYGALRPLDQIQPYRLEMATKNVFAGTAKTKAKATKLADWWKSSVTESILHDLSTHTTDTTTKLLLNLASDEYSAAVDASQLLLNDEKDKKTHDKIQYIKIVFWQEGRTIAVHAKRARGLMVRYIAEHHVTTIEGIQNFDMEGYAFVKSKSNDTTFVFDRPKQPKQPSSNTSTKKKKTNTKKNETTPSLSSSGRSNKKRKTRSTT